jgi:uncharacterized protein (DUF342 family)
MLLPTENPLTKFFPAQDRADGVYVKISPEARGALHIKDITVELDNAMITNYDVDRLVELLGKPSGQFEKAGPPFDYYDVDLEKYVDLGVTPMTAILKVGSAAITSGIKLTAPSLGYFLKRRGIIVGVKQDVLADIVKKGLFDKDVVVAEGQGPIAGADAKIVYEIATEKAAHPMQEQDGRVDFRNISTIVQAVKGKVLAHKEPPTPGTPGKSVRGDEILSTPGKDVALKPGKNTTVSDDGKFLIAAKSGYVYRQGDLVNIGELLTVSKDVDFSVGNIKYSGDVDIHGNVLPGFTVETDGNIHVKGDAESAKIISRNGSVVMEKGIVGKGDMVVSAKGEIKIVFAQAASITTEGTLTIGKYCLHCEVTCHAAVGQDAHSAFIGGSLTAWENIELGTVGNETGVGTRLFLYDKEEQAVSEKLHELSILEQKLNVELEPVKKQVRTKVAIFKQAGVQVSSRQGEELKKWLDSYNKLVEKLKYVREKSAGLQDELKKPRSRTGHVKITGDIFPGAEISLYGMTKTIKAHLVNKVFRVKDGAVVVEG